MMIRRAEEKDIPFLAKLLHQVNDLHADGRPDIFIHGKRKYSDAQLKDLLCDETRPVFVAADGETVVGYAFCVITQADSPNLKKEKLLYIDDICVDVNHRRSRVGSRLFRQVEAFAKENGCRRVTLNVWRLNDGAMRFYESLGMSPLKVTMEKII